VIARLAEALESTSDYLLGMETEDGTVSEGRVTEPVRRLAEIANRLSALRQEELVRIAAALEQFEREEDNKMAVSLDLTPPTTP
jgi:hypothetical protein